MQKNFATEPTDKNSWFRGLLLEQKTETSQTDQKDRLMSGALFSLLSSGLHLMRGELRSISCWNKQVLFKSPSRHVLKPRTKYSTLSLWMEAGEAAVTWVAVQDLLLVRIRSGVLVRSMSSFSGGCRVGAGRSSRRTCREKRRPCQGTPITRDLHGFAWTPGHETESGALWGLVLSFTFQVKGLEYSNKISF